MRRSPETQAALSLAERQPDRDWLDEITQRQEALAQRIAVGTPYSADQVLHSMRFQLVDDPPFWRHYNRAGRGCMVSGQPAADCLLYDLQGKSHSLLDLLQGRTLLLASSVS